MHISTISAREAQQRLQQGAALIDIRQPDEHQREHIQGAILCPITRLQAVGLPTDIASGSCVIFHCKSGMRTHSMRSVITELAKQRGCEVFILENGLNGWKAAGLATRVDRSQPLELMRQVQIAAGSLVLLGVLLGWLVTPTFYGLAAFVGAGLTFAGLTGFCGMAKLLALMPWNQVKQGEQTK